MVKIIKDVHKQGLLHRDIKPANFCLSKNGSVENLATGLEKIHLIDFGLSKKWDGENLMQATVGSPGYVPPEIFAKCFSENMKTKDCRLDTHAKMCGVSEELRSGANRK